MLQRNIRTTFAPALGVGRRCAGVFLLAGLLGCGRVEVDPIPDLPPPEAVCSESACTCPPGSHLVAEDGADCQYCPFGKVNSDPSATVCERAQVVTGEEHTCVLLADGSVRCWGGASWGQLGYGNTEPIGDNEAPEEAGPVELGSRALQLAAGAFHTCALLEGGDVRCWGFGAEGRLGQGDEEHIGDDEQPVDRPVIDLGEPALQVAAGGGHSCALLDGGRVRCWGRNELGELGNGDDENVGDDEPVQAGADVDLGGMATEVSLGSTNGCALMDTGHARCWGIMDFRDPTSEAAIRSPADAGDLPLPGRIEQLSLGGSSACAVIDGGRVRCWGEQSYGELGYPGSAMVEVEDARDVAVGGQVVEVETSEHHTCALLTTGNVRCWGGVPIGYPEFWPEQVSMTPEELGDVDVGGIVTGLGTGLVHTCALLHDGAVRCWGYGAGDNPDGTPSGGWLGYGNNSDIGDDETPASVGDVPYL